jgi:hypothetical protein
MRCRRENGGEQTSDHPDQINERSGKQLRCTMTESRQERMRLLVPNLNLDREIIVAMVAKAFEQEEG